MSHANSTPKDHGEPRRNDANSLSNESEADNAFAVAASGNTSDRQSQPSNAGFDSFAMTSLQSTAAAILAVQQMQSSSQYQFEHDNGLVYASSGITSGSESEAGLSRKASVSRRDSHGQGGKGNGMEKLHIERHMWSSEETQALVDGCNKHGIGNWKAILSDEQFNDKFSGRTAGDLKDRFRTYFPDAYHELYPNAKTHTSRAVRSKAPDGTSIFGKGKTKERRPFTPAEDEVLKNGYMRFGSHWAIIAKESVFEGKRKATDLRDRFRNAFPNLYEQAGYKPRTKTTKKERRQSSTGSHSDNPSAFLHVDSASNTSRPSLPPRSETSASAHSQAVSEHSEEDESDFDSHLPEPTEASFFGLGGDASLQAASVPVAMSRSHSYDLSASAQSLPQENTSGTTSPPNGSTLFSSSTTKQPLRRSHSSKRAQAKVHNLEQAVKSASIKCNKEALLASHQHVHHQHQQQKQQQQQQQQQQQPLQQQQQQPNAMLNVWQDRFAWEQSASGAGDGELADMDLDQMGEIINAHSAAQLLDSASAATEANGATTTTSTSASAEPLEMGDSSSANVNANNAFLANLYRELGLYGQGAPSSARTVAVDSFQDLLDPLGPAPGVLGSQWNSTNSASSTFSPWTPVSSSAAPQQEVSSPASAQRRDHEHNQWAGDLLHRGNFATLEEWNPDAFVNMANMQLGMGNLMSQTRPSEAGRSTGALPSTTGQRPPSQSLQGVQASSLPTPAQSLSMPSVHDLLSKSTSRSVSNPTRAGDEASESLLQSAYRNPYPYPADDLSLINSNLGGNMTLFPSLVGNDGQTNEGAFNAGGLSRRRRSTDTLRENAFQNGTGQSWRSTLDSLAAEQAAMVAGMSEDAGAEQRRDGSFSHHGGDERAPSLSSTDDHDAPSRAASVGNLNLQGNSMRDNGMYAESLPDPSPHDGFGNAHTGPSAFPNVQHMQMSFDDMDLPSFLNRSPSFAHASANVNGNIFSSPRMSSLVQDNTNWLKLAGATMRGQREGADAPRSVSGGHGQATASEGGAGPTSGNTMAQFSAASFGDAGALDRLEHLYLEVGGGGGGGGGQTTSYAAGGNAAGQQSGAQRFAINNSNNLFVPFERVFGGTSGGDAGSGYESV